MENVYCGMNQKFLPQLIVTEVLFLVKKGEWMKRQFIGTLEWKEYKKAEGGFRNISALPDQSSHSI